MYVMLFGKCERLRAPQNHNVRTKTQILSSWPVSEKLATILTWKTT
jgi:hypothetical protein